MTPRSPEDSNTFDRYFGDLVALAEKNGESKTSDNGGSPFPRDEFDRIRRELTERFGGVTAFTRSPAMGFWTDETGRVRPDELFSFEVMAETLDRNWWHQYREQLEQRFHQEEIVMRASSFERLSLGAISQVGSVTAPRLSDPARGGRSRPESARKNPWRRRH